MTILIGICIVFAIWFYYRVTDNKPPPDKNIDLYEVLDAEDATIRSVIKAIDDKLVGNAKNIIRDIKQIQTEQRENTEPFMGQAIFNIFFCLVCLVAFIVIFFGGFAYLLMWFADHHGG